MPQTAPSSLLDELTALAVDVAGAGAALAADLRARPLDIETKSTRTDLVTNADRAVEELVVGRILAARPGDGVLAEEGSTGAELDDAEVVWVIDPIDGTTNFVYDFPGWAVSVAARYRGTDVVGVVVDPRHGDTFVAAAGRGATRNGAPLRLGDPPPLAELLVATGFGYDPTRRATQVDVLRHLLPRVRDTRRMGAASVDLCSVACGRVDAYYELGLAAWDLAGGVVIAREAGARVEELHGGDPTPGGIVVAAHPAVWPELAGLLRDAGL